VPHHSNSHTVTLGVANIVKRCNNSINKWGLGIPLKKPNCSKNIFIMFPTITSTAIESINAGAKADQVEVTFTGGKSYTYGVNDLTAFATEVTRLVNAKESIGSYVNKSIRSGLLTSV